MVALALVHMSALLEVWLVEPSASAKHTSELDLHPEEGGDGMLVTLMSFNDGNDLYLC